MSNAAPPPVITADIGCPKCDYNLRGLSGESVTCPECGSQWQATEIQVERWRGGKDAVPGLMRAWAMPAAAFFGVSLLASAFEMIWQEYFSIWAPAGGLFVGGRLTRDVLIVGWASIVAGAGLLLLVLPVIVFLITSKKLGARLTARIALFVLIECAIVMAGMIAWFQVMSVGKEVIKAIHEAIAFPMWTSTPLHVIVRNAIVPRGIVAVFVILIAVFTLRLTDRALRRDLVAGLVHSGSHRKHLEPVGPDS